MSVGHLLVAALKERGWPTPSMEILDGWGFLFGEGCPGVLIMPTESHPGLIFLDISFSAGKVRGTGKKEGSFGEIIEAIDCFRWVLDLPPLMSAHKSALHPRDERRERIKASHDLDPCTANCRRCGATHEQFEDNLAPDICAGSHALHEAWMQQYLEYPGGPLVIEPPTPRQADEAVGLVPLSQPEPPKRDLAPFPERALR